MVRVQPRMLWTRLPYILALIGVLVIILSGFNIFLQRTPAVGVSVKATGGFQSDTDGQIDSLQGRLRVQPQDWDSYVLLGGAYLQKARETGDASYYTRAEDTLLEALALDPDNARAMSLLGSLAVARHEFEEALEWGQRSLEVNPYHAAAYGVRGDAQVELGRYDAAAESYQAMVDRKPNLDSYARISYIRELTGDVEGAIEAMAGAVAAGPPASENTAWARVQLGDLYFGSGKIDRASHQYEAALNEFPGYYLALGALGKARAAQGQYAEAIRLYKESIDIVPLPSTLATLGDLYAKDGKMALAQSQYDTVEFIASLGALNQQVYNRELALFYADHDIKLAEALELAARELEVRQDIYGYDAMAWALYKNQRLDEAAIAITEALHLGTKDAVLHYHAGKIFQGQGDNQRATLHLKRALELNPHFSVLHADDARQALSASRSEDIRSSYTGGATK